MNLVDQALVRAAVRDYAAGHRAPDTDTPTVAREVAETYLPQLVSRLGVEAVSAEARRCIEAHPDLMHRRPDERAVAIRRRGAAARQLLRAAGHAASNHDSALAFRLIDEAIAAYPALNTGDRRTGAAIKAMTEILLDAIPAPVTEITKRIDRAEGKREKTAGRSA
ncbi:hypothetical protein IU444_28975 [Nocardia farcinica]|uniref:hypothetical protein n=1 Tax=Nocardia farcinica TaxID=37329 RepID=UPI00189409EA|nr:hypothetical protein [Nocardia farcinica]MBF6388165.1 hypothetical protein [Nocardia farcinica]